MFTNIESNEDTSLLDLKNNDTILTLISSDGKSFRVASEITVLSGLINTITQFSTNDDEISFPDIQGHILEKVIEYMTRHHTHPIQKIRKPLVSNILSDVTDEWDANFMDIGNDMLFEVVAAANYMHISPLLELACAKVASLIKGKDTQAIRDILDIKNTMNPTKEAQCQSIYQWAQ